MKFPVIALGSGSPSTSATNYTGPGTTSWQATEATIQSPVSEDCTLTDLTIGLNVAPASGKSWLFTVRVNGVDTGATITISNTSTSGTWSGSVSLSDGDLVSVSSAPTGTPTAPAGTSVMLTFNTVGQSAFMMGVYAVNAVASNTSTGFSNVFGLSNTSATADNEIPASMSCTFTRLRAVTLGGNPGGGAKQYAVAFRTNATDQLTATIAGTNATALATGSVAGSVGDLMDIKIDPTGSPTGRRIAWAVSYSPATFGESMFGLGTSNVISTNTTTFNLPSGPGTTWSTPESSRVYNLQPALVFKNLIFICSTAPAGAATRTLTLRDNSASTALTCQITGAATSAQDTTHTVTMTGGMAPWDWQLVNAGSPAAAVTGDFHIGWTIVTAQSNTVAVVPCAATASAPIPVSLVAPGAVVAAATASISSPVPAVAFDTPAAQATASAPSPGLSTAPTAVAAAATASISPPSPIVAPTAPVAAAVASISPPAPTVAPNAVVAAATASASPPVPTVVLGAPPASATASAPPPSASVVVQAAVAAAMATMPAPVPSISLLAPPAQATASIPPPTPHTFLRTILPSFAALIRNDAKVAVIPLSAMATIAKLSARATLSGLHAAAALAPQSSIVTIEKHSAEVEVEPHSSDVELDYGGG